MRQRVEGVPFLMQLFAIDRNKLVVVLPLLVSQDMPRYSGHTETHDAPSFTGRASYMTTLIK